MPDDTDFEPGSILGRFGFSAEGNKDDKPVIQKSAPNASPADPGSILRRFGFDEKGEPINKTVKEPSTTATSTIPDVEARAKDLAKREDISGAVVRGMPIVGPLMQRAEAAGNAVMRPLLGLPTGGYSSELEAIRRAGQLYGQEHPGREVSGNVLGAGFSTAPLAATALGGRALGAVGETLGSRAYQGALGGAGIGAADAALRGEDPIQGGAIGGVAGFGGPIVGEALGRGWTAVSNALRSAPVGLTGTNQIARDWLSGAMANETPASIAAARSRMGPQGFVGDINPSMTELTAGMATRAEPPASADIGEAYRTRQVGQAQTIENAVTRAMGPRVDVVNLRNMITEERRRVADPLYQQFRDTQVQPTAALNELIPRLEAAGAFDQAEKLGAITGQRINRDFFTLSPATQRPIGSMVSAYPTTQTWDLVKRGLDSKIDQAYGAGDRNLARVLVDLRGQMINEIERTPAGNVWRQARQAFASRSQLLDQLDAGRDTFLGGRSGTSADELREELRGLSGPELAARIQGARDAITQAMGASRNGDTQLRNRLLAPNNQDKLRLLLGDHPANGLIDTLRQQEFLSDQAKYVNPRAGSPTAPRTQAAGALSAPPLPHWDPSISRPLSWIPPGVVDALRPSTILQGSREARYAAARQQLGNVLTSQDVAGFVRSIDAENAARAAAAGRGRTIQQGSTLAITGPGAEEGRKKKLPRGALSFPAY